MKAETRAQQPATMVTRFIRKILPILANTCLEWVLIIFLLFNSLFCYLIRRFANYFGLKPPCPWCSKVDRLLEPAKSIDPYKFLVCDSHASEISKLTYCPNHKKLIESWHTCKECCISQPMYYDNEEKRSTCSCCEKTLSTKLQCQHSFPLQENFEAKEIEEQTEKRADCGPNVGECEQQILSDVGSFYLRDAAEDSNEDEETESGMIQTCERTKEDQTETPNFVATADENPTRPVLPDVVTELLAEHKGEEQKDNDTKEQEIFYVERKADMKKMKSQIDVEAFFIIQKMRCDLDAERKARQDLSAELEAERNAAAIAANETMAMITRLQEEKAAMQMEALQYQRVMEEQSQYDHEALRLLNELVAKRENEKHELEKELEVYHKRVSDYEAKEKEKMMMMIKTCGNSFSSDSETDALSIDLHQQYDEDEGREDLSLLECSKQWGFIEDSLEEHDEERLSIIKQLKELEEKLNDKLEETEMKMQEPNAELCGKEVNLDTSCFSNDLVTVEHAKTMASTARELLDLVGSSDDESDNEAFNGDTKLALSQVESGGERIAIEQEITHVYGRLQALEADTEFLRHCIGSLNKGNQGVNFLHEILKHLRELRAAEICL